MGRTMLLGVLRMPRTIWARSDLDELQRESAYNEAADEIERLDAERDALLKAVREVYDTHQAMAQRQNWEPPSCACRLCELIEPPKGGDGDDE